MAISLNADQGVGLSEKLDTLAESFLVDRPIFVTKLDLYFSQKGGNLPIEVSLRKVENDSPSQNIIPNSHVVIDIDDINTSANALVATSVQFPYPVFLESGEYCFTLGSDTKQNRVYTATLGGQDISSKAMISKQPYTGVMFMSSNGSQWTIDQTRDIKFKLHCAKFTSDFATVDFKLKNDGLDNLNIKYLNREDFRTFDGSDVIRVNHVNHGFIDGRFVKLNGISGGLDYMANANTIVTINNIPFDRLDNVLFQVANVSTTGYTITATLSDAERANVTGGSFPYSGAAVTTMLPYSTLVSGISEVVPLKASTVHKIRTTDESLQLSEYETVEFGTMEFEDTQLIVDYYNNEISMSDSESLNYRVEMSTNDEYVSPVINVPFSSLLFITPDINNPSLDDNLTIDNRLIANLNANVSFTFSNVNGFINVVDADVRANVKTMQKGSFITVSGASANNNGTLRIVSVASDGSYIEVPNVETEPSGNLVTLLHRPMYVADEASSGSSSRAKYIIRKIPLVNPSTSLNIRMTISKPSGSNIEIYYKTQTEDPASFENKEFSLLELGDIPNTLTNEYMEIEANIDGLNPFDAFGLKIALKSNSIAKYPSVSDLRIIALQ